jgi:hypothetical protein
MTMPDPLTSIDDLLPGTPLGTTPPTVGEPAALIAQVEQRWQAEDREQALENLDEILDWFQAVAWTERRSEDITRKLLQASAAFHALGHDMTAGAVPGEYA